jgi:phosphoribosylamine--glycine ligase
MSLFLAIDKNTVKIIGSAQDYKRVFDRNLGPNTGGMGAFSPSPLMNKKLGKNIIKNIIEPTLQYMNDKNTPFSGILYAGLMIKSGLPKLIEYNVRFGDPECQVLCSRLGAQILDILLSGATNKLSELSINLAKDHSLTVVLAAIGYPNAINSGLDITSVVNQKYHKELNIFHSGTYMDEKNLRNSGGRVFNFTSVGPTLLETKRLVYSELKKVNNKGLFYRNDIGD